MDELTSKIFQLITNSGDARSTVFEALGAAQAGNMDKANRYIGMAKEGLIAAHKVQTELIQQESSGDKLELSLLMVHAQDHLMTSMLAKDLIEKMIYMQNEINELKNNK
ncbi:PTS system, cellobiose-specific IIA component [Propionispira arboris]|jgi:PTS system cellobiose-specific IIA component|uniref:PTS system, cellobiose-specific IIA component n=1 Tax=Propionispira arboris TaxID=84035 RepID=A0A1H7BCG4_9FIRM|nr:MULTISPECIES: PTS lactose/cellobiose transporter subunit IIA [Propionispira]SEJ75351.1 PTS system, cellobiose-specific IIA component [Propionispira arboris]